MFAFFSELFSLMKSKQTAVRGPTGGRPPETAEFNMPRMHLLSNIKSRKRQNYFAVFCFISQNIADVLADYSENRAHECQLLSIGRLWNIEKDIIIKKKQESGTSMTFRLQYHLMLKKTGLNSGFCWEQNTETID